MKASEHERRDWVIIAIILLIGLVCVLLAGGWAIRLSPSWQLVANMGSNLNPNSDFLTSRPAEFIEPLDPSILTLPVWINVFLTPGASFSTRIPAATGTPDVFIPPTKAAPATQTVTPTSTFVYFIPTQTSTSNPAFTRTSAPVRTSTSTSTPISTATQTKTSTPSSTGTSTRMPSITPLPQADLQISKNDGINTYQWDIPIVYTVTVINNGPSMVTGAVIADNLPSQIAAWTWACVQYNGATGCDGISNSTSNFTDTINLPNSASIVYTITADIPSGTVGNLVNTATVNPPVTISDPVPGNNSATDTDYGIIGTDPDDVVYNLPENGVLTLNITTVVNGHAGPDLVYYEFLNNGMVYLDWAIIEIGDGTNWYTVLYWGDNVADTNTNVDFTTLPPLTPPEPDERSFAPDTLYNNSGVTIDLDLPFIPQSTYSYVRITAPPGDRDHQLEIDAIVPLP